MVPDHGDVTVSVVLPVYNGERYLTEAIDSVLSQRHPRLELIVVDDGSTDRSATIARSYAEIRYVRQSNKGVGPARNRGVELAGGTLLGFIDHDDRWTTEKLARQMAVLENRPDVDAVFGHARQFYSPELGPEIRRRVRIPREVIPAQTMGAMLVRRGAFDKVGPLQAWTIGADVSWYMRAVDAGLTLEMLPDVVYERRIHDRNQGSLARDDNYDRLQVLKAALDRRRLQSS